MPAVLASATTRDQFVMPMIFGLYRYLSASIAILLENGMPNNTVMSKIIETSKTFNTEREAQIFMLGYNLGSDMDHESHARIDEQEKQTVLLDMEEEAYIEFVIAASDVECEHFAQKTVNDPVALLNKFPDMRINSNCLEDKACPKCGNRDEFRIDLKTQANLVDDGTDANVGDHEYDDDSVCVCEKCRFTTQLSDFTFEGLDALIAERKETA